MTVERRRTITAMRAWVLKHERKKALSVRHVHTRAYVVARLGAKCIIVAYPVTDAETQVKGFDTGHTWVSNFDPWLKLGDWCALAYVSREGRGDHVAIALEPDPTVKAKK